MVIFTRVKLVLAEAPDSVLPGIKVSLFDRDLNDQDDLLGTGSTDENGEVLFRYDSRDYTDAEDGPAWRAESLPDLYVVVYDDQGQRILSTRKGVIKDKLPDLIQVPVSRELVEEHNLLAG